MAHRTSTDRRCIRPRLSSSCWRRCRRGCAAHAARRSKYANATHVTFRELSARFISKLDERCEQHERCRNWRCAELALEKDDSAVIRCASARPRTAPAALLSSTRRPAPLSSAVHQPSPRDPVRRMPQKEMEGRGAREEGGGARRTRSEGLREQRARAIAQPAQPSGAFFRKRSARLSTSLSRATCPSTTSGARLPPVIRMMKRTWPIKAPGPINARYEPTRRARIPPGLT